MIQENQFDRGKIYYPLVMHFIYSIHGFIDLASRGLINEVIKKKNSNLAKEVDTLFESLIMDDNTKEQFRMSEKPSPLIGKLEFKKHYGNSIKVDINEIAEEILNHGVYNLENIFNSAYILLISAYEKTKSWDNQSVPIWNFFYHCRNASAHNGRFRIQKDRFPAKWHQLEITKEHNGKKLFKGQDGNGLLYPGDVIALLWDIEQISPSMKIK